MTAPSRCPSCSWASGSSPRWSRCWCRWSASPATRRSRPSASPTSGNSPRPRPRTAPRTTASTQSRTTFKSPEGGKRVTRNWDFTTIEDGGGRQVQPGLIWEGSPSAEVQQCPSYQVTDPGGDPYTGYNYNTSYIGHGEGETIPLPASAAASEASRPLALFGDGQYCGGARQVHAGARSPIPATPPSATAPPARRATATAARPTSPSATATPRASATASPPPATPAPRGPTPGFSQRTIRCTVPTEDAAGCAGYPACGAGQANRVE